MIFDFISPVVPVPKPTSAPAIPTIGANPIDHRLVAAVGSGGDQPVAVWTVIREVVEAEHPTSRRERRLLEARTLCRVRALLHQGVLVRCNKRSVCLSKPVKSPVPAPAKPFFNLPPALPPTVAEFLCIKIDGPRTRIFEV